MTLNNSINLSNAGTNAITATGIAANINFACQSAGNLYFTAGGYNGITVAYAGVTFNNISTFNNSISLTTPITSTNVTKPVSGQLGYNYIANTGIVTAGNNAPTSLGTFLIPAGTWLIIGTFNFTASAVNTAIVRMVQELSLASATFGNGITQLSNYTPMTLSTISYNVQYQSSGVFNFTTATNIYANVLVNITAGSLTEQCFINVLRIA